jgi:hypothetical protein
MRSLTTCALAACAVVLASPAAAQTAATEAATQAGTDGYDRREIPERTWRRKMAEKEEARRPRSTTRHDIFEPTHFAFELRFGPYWPEVDEPFGGSGPYELFFEDDPLFYFGIEVDWLALHIPYVGSIGPGIGWGMVQASGKTRLQEDVNVEAGADTGLMIFPMYGAAVFRLDGPLRQSRFPIVPHAKLGLGWGLWRASGASGTSNAGGVDAEGTSLGMHLALGGSLALNAFDADAAKSLRTNTGIHYTYLYGEWMWSNLDGIGSSEQMHVGTSTGIVGLALDF